jgi:AcrR family transcriptional regulator
MYVAMVPTPASSVKREPLTPDRIVEAALAIADAEGLDALTMRRLALELGVAPMAAYAHFGGKRALLAAVVDAVMGEIELPEADGRWRKPVRRMALSFRRALLAHPAVMPAFHAHGAHGPNTLAVIDRAHRILRRAGFADDQAARAFDTLYAFALGSVSLEIAQASVDPAARHAALVALPSAGYPDLAAVLPHVVACDPDDRFRYGLDRILDGLGPRRAT